MGFQNLLIARPDLKPQPMMYSLRLPPSPGLPSPWKPGISFLSPWICYCGYFTDMRSHHARPLGSGFPHVALRSPVQPQPSMYQHSIPLWRSNIDKLMYERASQTQRRTLAAKGESGGGEGLGGRAEQMQTRVHRRDKQHGPAAEHQERASTSCDKPSWK